MSAHLRSLRRIRSLALAALMGFISTPSLAQLEVIADYGNTRPSGIPSFEDIEKVAKRTKIDVSEAANMVPYSFPIESQLMQLGKLYGPIKHGKEGIIPFFVIGADATSKKWLIDNKEYLIKNGMDRGVVTNVSDAHQYKEMTDAASPISLYVMNVDDLARALNVQVYPIVVGKEEIAQ